MSEAQDMPQDGNTNRSYNEDGMTLSVVIPVYNEEENIPLLHSALTDALTTYTYELIYVNDGSKDGSLTQLENLLEKDADHIIIVDLRRNFGQTTAIAAGIDHSQGEVIVLIDADLQNDPTDIPRMANIKSDRRGTS